MLSYLRDWVDQRARNSLTAAEIEAVLRSPPDADPEPPEDALDAEDSEDSDDEMEIIAAIHREQRRVAPTPKVIDVRFRYAGSEHVTVEQRWSDGEVGLTSVPLCTPKNPPTHAQRIQWESEVRRGVFTLENAHIWPHDKRRTLLVEHGFHGYFPDAIDPYVKRSIPTRFKKQTLTCKMCSKQFKRTNMFREHLNTHFDLKPFLCRHRDCDRGFADHSNRRAHERSAQHGGVARLRCNTCVKTFQHRDSLRAHELTHTKAPPPASYTCGRCGKIYANAQNCNRHKKKVHPGYHEHTKKKRKRVHVSAETSASARRYAVSVAAEMGFAQV